jgi:hypothetical protein
MNCRAEASRVGGLVDLGFTAGLRGNYLLPKVPRFRFPLSRFPLCLAFLPSPLARAPVTPSPRHPAAPWFNPLSPKVIGQVNVRSIGVNIFPRFFQGGNWPGQLNHQTTMDGGRKMEAQYVGVFAAITRPWLSPTVIFTSLVRRFTASKPAQIQKITSKKP